PCGLRYERDPPHAMRRDEGRAFLCGAVHIARDHLAVPVYELGRVGVVVDVHHRALAFLEAQQRAGELAVVEGRRDDVIRRQFGKACRDPQGVVGFTLFLLRGLFGGTRRTRCLTCQREQCAVSQKSAAVDHRRSPGFLKLRPHNTVGFRYRSRYRWSRPRRPQARSCDRKRQSFIASPVNSTRELKEASHGSGVTSACEAPLRYRMARSRFSEITAVTKSITARTMGVLPRSR